MWLNADLSVGEKLVNDTTEQHVVGFRNLDNCRRLKARCQIRELDLPVCRQETRGHQKRRSGPKSGILTNAVDEMKQARFVKTRTTDIINQHRIFGGTMHHTLADRFRVSQQRACCCTPDFCEMCFTRTRWSGKDHNRGNPVRPAINQIHSRTV